MYKSKLLHPDHLYPLVGQNIRRLRKQKGITQEQLAELIDGDQKYISKIEAGKARPSLSLYLKIANVFQVSIDSFFIGVIELHGQSIDTEYLLQQALGGREKKLVQDILYTVFRYLDKK